MKTRHAPPGTPLQQKRFASSPDIDRGLLANLVALRAASLATVEAAFVWRIHRYSHLPGGLQTLAAELLSRWPVNESDNPCPVYPVAGSNSDPDDSLTELERYHRARRKYAAAQESLERLPEEIARLALDAELPVLDGWCKGYPQLVSRLRELFALKERETLGSVSETETTRLIWREIDDVRELGGTVLLHNDAATGKSFAARSYCDIHAGAAWYFQPPSTNDMVGFFRALCEAGGLASGLSFKAVQMREKIQQTLRTRQIVLVIDGAQWLFPVSDYRYALPERIDWVLRALSEQGVPVVMIANSKLFDTLGFVEARTGWNRNKLVNQLSRVVELPGALSIEDVRTVAVGILPDAERAAQRKLADYMIVCPGYLHGGAPAAQRARRIAASHGRDRVSIVDMDQALESYLTPSLKAAEAAFKRADDARGRCKAKVRNWRPETPAQLAAKKSGKQRSQIVTSSDLRGPAAGPQTLRSPTAGGVRRLRDVEDLRPSPELASAY